METNETSPAQSVQLDPAEVSTLAEYQQAIHDAQQQMQGVYRLISKQHNLTGQWELSEDGKSLIRRG